MSGKFKIALISVYVIENNGVRFLGATCRNAGYEVVEIYFKDYVHHHFVPPEPKEYDLLIALLKEKAPDLVGISLRAGAYLPVAKHITQRIKAELHVPVMWGGPHVSMAPENCLDHADFLVMGESEQALPDVAATVEKNGDVSGCENVWMKKGGEVIKNPLRPLCRDLDSLPFRDYHSNDSKFTIRKNRVISGEPMLGERLYLMITSRGCLYNCAYCDVSSLRKLYQGNGQFYRYRSVENCLEELEYARSVFKGLRRVRFDDELFVPDKAWIKEFAQKYPTRIGLPFEILSDPRCLDEWSVKALAGAGMDRVMIGIQGDEKTNRRLYNRPVSDDQVREIAAIFKRHNVRGIFQVIVDDPENTRERTEALLALLLSLPRPYDLYMFSLCHWPGSDRTDALIEKGLITCDLVEGQSNKVLTQFMADFSYTRKPEDTFFLALFQLSNKTLVPRAVVRRLARSEWLRIHPRPLVLLAKFTNLTKLFATGFSMLLRGEVSINTIRRWIHIFDSPST